MNFYDVWAGENGESDHNHGPVITYQEAETISGLDTHGCHFIQAVWLHGKATSPQALVWPMNLDEPVQGSLYVNGKLHGYSTVEH